MNLQISKVLKLQNIYNKIHEQKLPIKLTYKISKLFSAINEETEFYYEKLREIVDNYAERDEGGNPVSANDGLGVKIQKDLIPECQKQLNELTSLEVMLPDIRFTLDELEPMDMTVDDFTLLLPFVDE